MSMDDRRVGWLVRAVVALTTVGVVGTTAYAVLLGCGSSSPPPRRVAPASTPVWMTIPSGVVESRDVTISASDGSFRLEGPRADQPPPMFRTPFSVQCNHLGRLSPAAWKTAGNLGARPVEIIVPGRQRPLYGVLALCKAHPNDGSAAARSYRIVVPKDRVAQTSGGRVSYVYELGAKVAGRSWATWVLWLSESPLPVSHGGVHDAPPPSSPAGERRVFR